MLDPGVLRLLRSTMHTGRPGLYSSQEPSHNHSPEPVLEDLENECRQNGTDSKLFSAINPRTGEGGNPSTIIFYIYLTENECHPFTSPPIDIKNPPSLQISIGMGDLFPFDNFIINLWNNERRPQAEKKGRMFLEFHYGKPRIIDGMFRDDGCPAGDVDPSTHIYIYLTEKECRLLEREKDGWIRFTDLESKVAPIGYKGSSQFWFSAGDRNLTAHCYIYLSEKECRPLKKVKGENSYRIFLAENVKVWSDGELSSIRFYINVPEKESRPLKKIICDKFSKPYAGRLIGYPPGDYLPKGSMIIIFYGKPLNIDSKVYENECRPSGKGNANSHMKMVSGKRTGNSPGDILSTIRFYMNVPENECRPTDSQKNFSIYFSQIGLRKSNSEGGNLSDQFIYIKLSEYMLYSLVTNQVYVYLTEKKRRPRAVKKRRSMKVFCPHYSLVSDGIEWMGNTRMSVDDKNLATHCYIYLAEAPLGEVRENKEMELKILQNREKMLELLEIQSEQIPA